ncbi:hypothetical protein [Desulfosporosinus fructosivorans]|uniref:hypothetical protein n=1 Tax=Desulfosporosinus fructosivorans TaxID=2018669 RepID=UPI00130D5802|nr:hypothetical protein [Desulfosporosinus fructosivorans]
MQHDLVDRLRKESALLWNDILDIHQETCDRTREQRAQGNLDWKYPWRYKQNGSVLVYD